MIEIKNVKLNIDNIDILNDISFKVEDNSVTCILGNKNSGKSSLLKLIAGVYEDYYGEVIYDGKYINEIKNIEIDLVEDNREKDDDITVVEYLQFYGAIYNKMQTDELNAYIDKMLKQFSLMSYKYTNINLLENENYKLVDLIRVSINDSKVLLLDNLFSSENMEFNEKLFEYIKTLIGKKTIIFASRNLSYIEEIVDNIGILETGNLIEYGKKNDIYRKAGLSNRIEIELIDGIGEAIELLKQNENIANIVYNDNLISFSLITNMAYQAARNELENEILKKLIENNIKVYSFRKQGVRFKQLFEKIRG